MLSARKKSAGRRKKSRIHGYGQFKNRVDVGFRGPVVFVPKFGRMIKIGTVRMEITR
jgi:hypothetical protein